MGGGGVKNYEKLRDVIYEQPHSFLVRFYHNQQRKHWWLNVCTNVTSGCWTARSPWRRWRTSWATSRTRSARRSSRSSSTRHTPTSSCSNRSSSKPKNGISIWTPISPNLKIGTSKAAYYNHWLIHIFLWPKVITLSGLFWTLFQSYFLVFNVLVLFSNPHWYIFTAVCEWRPGVNPINFHCYAWMFVT